MPPKKKGKKGKKKKKAPKIDPNALTEVDKTFYELTITDLNRKLARLRSLTTELEEKNEQLQNDLTKLDEDRNDIIIYLKRILQEKNDEIAELQDRLKALEETRQDETETYEAKIQDLENEYKQMHEQLTSEIKLLEGKLNSLEEFRIQRDELMKKFEEQEIAMEEQEKRHKNEVYEIERKFIIAKDKLKKDMEARLLQLSSEFQEATELRIAATTHRVIRENIAINNELDSMLMSHDKLYTENAEIKVRDKTLRQEAQLHEEEKKKALAKVRTQLKIIERLTTEHENMTQKLANYQTIEKEMHDICNELQKTKQTILCLNHQIRVLEQNVHGLKCKELSMQTEIGNLEEENDRLTTLLAQAVYAIKEVLEVQTVFSDEALRTSKRESLLTQLFNLLTESEKKKARRPSMDTIGSLSATYQRGDLGFVPKPATSRSVIPTIRHIQAQTGASFEEFLAIGKEEDLIQKASTSFISLEEEEEGEMESVEEESDVYFDEEEDSMEESYLDFDMESFDEDAEGAPKKSVRSTRSNQRLEGEGEDGSTRRKSSSKRTESRRGIKVEADESKTSVSRMVSISKESTSGREGSKTAVPKASLSGDTKRKSQVRIAEEATTVETSRLTEDSNKQTDQVATPSEGEDTTAETSPLPEDSVKRPSQKSILSKSKSKDLATETTSP
ncbi:cilia- and flagella-associated protein 157 [Zophobas morio]|uniref:cilia- and flagella-associated protein 157 n=1 Tax=Zophobas morio TaxID=2755281 RepID=UPI0030831EDC